MGVASAAPYRIIGIYNTGGTKVGGYAYDAWGNCTITLNTNGIAARNPIRYRGYYYDEEFGLYYLNARYYSPEWRRFISPDDTAYIDPESVNGLNFYAYCNNDPVNHVDPSGHSSTAWWEWALTGIVVIGLIVGAIFTGGTLIGAASYALGATIGGVTIGFTGAIAIGAVVVVVGIVAGTILIAVVSNALDNWWEQKKEEWFS